MSHEVTKNLNASLKNLPHVLQEKKNAINPLLQNPELQKLIDFPEPTLNDADADKDLMRVQRKAKYVLPINYE